MLVRRLMVVAMLAVATRATAEWTQVVLPGDAGTLQLTTVRTTRIDNATVQIVMGGSEAAPTSFVPALYSANWTVGDAGTPIAALPVFVVSSINNTNVASASQGVTCVDFGAASQVAGAGDADAYFYSTDSAATWTESYSGAAALVLATDPNFTFASCGFYAAGTNTFGEAFGYTAARTATPLLCRDATGFHIDSNLGGLITSVLIQTTPTHTFIATSSGNQVLELNNLAATGTCPPSLVGSSPLPSNPGALGMAENESAGVVVSNSGAGAWYNAVGGTWVAGTTIPDGGSFSGVSSPSTRYSLAVGTEKAGTPAYVAGSYDNNLSFQKNDVPSFAAGTSLSAVHCPDENTCVAVGTAPGGGLILLLKNKPPYIGDAGVPPVTATAGMPGSFVVPLADDEGDPIQANWFDAGCVLADAGTTSISSLAPGATANAGPSSSSVSFTVPQNCSLTGPQNYQLPVELSDGRLSACYAVPVMVTYPQPISGTVNVVPTATTPPALLQRNQGVPVSVDGLTSACGSPIVYGWQPDPSCNDHDAGSCVSYDGGSFSFTFTGEPSSCTDFTYAWDLTEGPLPYTLPAAPQVDLVGFPDPPVPVPIGDGGVTLDYGVDGGAPLLFQAPNANPDCLVSDAGGGGGASAGPLYAVLEPVAGAPCPPAGCVSRYDLGFRFSPPAGLGCGSTQTWTYNLLGAVARAQADSGFVTSTDAGGQIVVTAQWPPSSAQIGVSGSSGIVVQCGAPSQFALTAQTFGCIPLSQATWQVQPTPAVASPLTGNTITVGAAAGQFADFADVSSVAVQLSACDVNGANCQAATTSLPVSFDRMLQLTLQQEQESVGAGTPARFAVQIANQASCAVGPVTLRVWLDGVEWVAGSARIGGAPVAAETSFAPGSRPPPSQSSTAPFTGRGYDLLLGSLPTGASTVTFAVFPQHGPAPTASLLTEAYVGIHSVSTPAAPNVASPNVPAAPDVLACNCGSAGGGGDVTLWWLIGLGVAQVKMMRRVSRLSLRGSKTPRS